MRTFASARIFGFRHGPWRRGHRSHKLSTRPIIGRAHISGAEMLSVWYQANNRASQITCSRWVWRTLVEPIEVT